MKSFSSTKINYFASALAWRSLGSRTQFSLITRRASKTLEGFPQARLGCAPEGPMKRCSALRCPSWSSWICAWDNLWCENSFVGSSKRNEERAQSQEKGARAEAFNSDQESGLLSSLRPSLTPHHSVTTSARDFRTNHPTMISVFSRLRLNDDVIILRKLRVLIKVDESLAIASFFSSSFLHKLRWIKAVTRFPFERGLDDKKRRHCWAPAHNQQNIIRCSGAQTEYFIFSWRRRARRRRLAFDGMKFSCLSSSSFLRPLLPHLLYVVWRGEEKKVPSSGVLVIE